MTEAEWLACEDPAPMFYWLGKETSERKLRLFACACCRHIWHLLTDEERAIVDSAERYADRLIPAKEMYAVAGFSPAYADPATGSGEFRNAWKAATEAASSHAWTGARRARAFVVDAFRFAAGPGERTAEWQRQSDALRCIFGNPFRPVAIDPAWLTPNVLDLARTIYDEPAFDRLLILADALMDAGCDSDAILDHCRGSGPHVRGCWVVDLILDKS